MGSVAFDGWEVEVIDLDGNCVERKLEVRNWKVSLSKEKKNKKATMTTLKICGTVGTIPGDVINDVKLKGKW